MIKYVKNFFYDFTNLKYNSPKRLYRSHDILNTQAYERSLILCATQ